MPADENLMPVDRATPARGVGPRRALYIDSPVYAQAAYSPHHPLAIARTQTVAELCRLNGWLPAGAYRRCEAAPLDVLTRFHSRDYVRALQHADRSGHVLRSVRERYAIGTMENPIFNGVFERAATTVGGSIAAAELALEGRVIYHPAGGTHHGRPDRASGFCYFNDPVFAIATFLERGIERVLYVDLDAHHGDGVEDAWRDDPRVALFSIHEADRWPHTGLEGSATDEPTCNVPVPRGCNDSEFNTVLDEIFEPFAAAMAPQAVVITCGADALAGDPLSGMMLSNVALWAAVERIARLAAPVVVLGGGGYNPWTVARCWAGLWARLSGQRIGPALSAPAVQALSGLECDLVDEEDFDPRWLDTLVDVPNPGPVRPEIMALVERWRTRNHRPQAVR
jgi:acetoin utilization protein AcuC